MTDSNIVSCKINLQIYGLLGATLLGVCLTQDSCVLPIALSAAVCLGLVRFLSLRLMAYKAKGEMPIKKWVFNMRQLMSALSETVWAMLVNYTVGTSLFPIVHKSPLVGGDFSFFCGTKMFYRLGLYGKRVPDVRQGILANEGENPLSFLWVGLG